MSIATRIENINNNLKNAYDSLEDLGVDLENTNRNLQNLSMKIDTLYNELPKVTSEGTEITLTPTRKGRMQLDLKGNTSQDSTTGKNLANLSILNQVPSTTNGELVIFGAGVCTELIEIDNTKDIVFSFSQTEDRQKYIMFYGENQNYLGYSIGMQTDWLLSENQNYSNSKYVRIRFDSKATTNWCQLEYNSTATDYEPYTGGQPSPNPDYPQDIEAVTGNNQIIIEGKNINNSILELGGLNQWGKYDLNNTIRSKDYVSVKNSTTYAFSSNKTIDLNSVGVVFYTKTKTYISTQYLYTNHPEFTTPKTCEYIMYKIVNNTDITQYIQIELGSAVTTFESYQEPQIYPIVLGELKLYKIGEYQDYLYKENSNWYKYNAIGKKVLNGTETWSKADSVMSGSTRFYVNFNDIINNSNDVDSEIIYVTSNKFQSTYWLDMYQLNVTNKFLISNINNSAPSVKRIVIRIDSNLANDSATLKTWLSTNNVIVYYVKSTGTTTQITDTTLISQLDAIEKAKSDENQTNITQTNADLPFIISATALLKND